jgi:hypothetical protein
MKIKKIIQKQIIKLMGWVRFNRTWQTYIASQGLKFNADRIRIHRYKQFPKDRNYQYLILILDGLLGEYVQIKISSQMAHAMKKIKGVDSGKW